MSSKIPSGFKTREEYNAYMREYRAQKKAGIQLLKRENKWLKKAIVALSEAQS